MSRKISEQVHPMIPVPQALGTVLRETASNLLKIGNQEVKEEWEKSITEVLPVEDTSMTLTTTDLLHEKRSVLPNKYSSLLGRVSAQTVQASEIGYPPYNASIMDGYAIQVPVMDLQNSSETTLDFEVVDRVHAGPRTLSSSNNKTGSEGSNTVIYITTGAPIPSPYNAVIPIEDTRACQKSKTNSGEEKTKLISISTKVLNNVKEKSWVRPIGCDIPPKTAILSKGETIEPVHIGLLVQCGIREVQVLRTTQERTSTNSSSSSGHLDGAKINVGILSTGNELIHPNDTKEDISQQQELIGQIPDANRPTLLSLLTSYNMSSCKMTDLGIANDDDINGLRAKLIDAIFNCDVIITTGGISMGDKDVMEQALITLEGREGESNDVNELPCAKIHFGRLHMKPGKPTTFATVDRAALLSSLQTNKDRKVKESTTESTKKNGKCLIFAMPGNPVSAVVCTELLVRPCLDMMNSHILESKGNDFDNEKPTIKLSPSRMISSMVQNARVHSEIMATLQAPVKLDVERPEYHRVSLSISNNNSHEGQSIIKATSTGVQRSSRLMSLCNSDGFMMLPQGKRGEKMAAQAGEAFPVLLTQKGGDNFFGSYGKLQWKDCMHFNATPMAVGILEIKGQKQVDVESSKNSCNSRTKSALTHSLADRVSQCLGKNAAVICEEQQLCLEKKWTNTLTKAQIFNKLIANKDGTQCLSDCLDVIIVVCTNTTFQDNLEISHLLRSLVLKEADSLSLQIRRGASHEYGLSALFEPVVGYLNREKFVTEKDTMLVSVPNDGLDAALEATGPLLRRALYLARGI